MGIQIEFRKDDEWYGDWFSFLTHNTRVLIAADGQDDTESADLAQRLADALGDQPGREQKLHAEGPGKSPADWLRWLDNLPADEREHAAEAVLTNSHVAHGCRSAAHDRWQRQMREALDTIAEQVRKGLAQ